MNEDVTFKRQRRDSASTDTYSAIAPVYTRVRRMKNEGP